MKRNKLTYEELEKQIVELKKQNQFVKQSAKTSKISDNKYRKMLGNIGDVIVIVDKDGNNAYKSPNIENFFGWKPEELIGKSTFANVHPEDIDFAKEFIATIIEKPDTVKTIEVRYKCKDGSYRWIQFTCSNHLNDPDINGLLGNYHDITEQKTAIKELIEAKEKANINMEMILNSQSLANICSYSTNLIETDIEKSSWVCSPELYKIFGIDESYPHTIAGWAGFIHPDYRDELFAYHEDVVKNRTSFNHEYKIIRINDGAERWVKGTGELVYDEQGTPVRMHGAIQDITEIKNTECELIKAKEKAEESEQAFRKLFEDSSDAILLIDKTGVFVECNQAALALLKTTREHFLFKPPIDISPKYQPDGQNSEQKALKMINIAYEKRLHRFDWACVNSEGNEFIVEVSLMPIKVKGELMLHTTWRDITERIQQEKELKIAKEKAEESDRLKTEFINNMSHEIRTPMNGIIGFAQMLDTPNLSHEKRKYFTKIVQNSSNQLLRVIEDIMQISKLETKQVQILKTEFYLNDLLMELFSIFSMKSKERNLPLYLKKELKDAQSQIVSDKVKLNIIISNLLENALKFTNDGFIEFGYFIKDTLLTIYVKDTGVGISQKKQDSIFERFSQEDREISMKHGGLGLGLSISKENAQLLGGDITLVSEKGNGATFLVSIPYKPVSVSNNLSSENNTNSNDTYTILVAEDEEVNYLYIETIFEEEFEGNYNLIHAKNGQEAVDICTQNNNIDLILMDIKMPIKNGYKATEEIKLKFPNLPIIAQTAYSTESDKEIAIKHGCDEFISKPINMTNLFELVNKYHIAK